MGFTPNNSGGNKTTYVRDPNKKFPEPKAGNRPARVSLIVDMGIQLREDFEDQTTGETRPQKPCWQLALFADLTNDIVDYGQPIGMQPYRQLLNKSFGGVLEGVNFQTTPPKNADGKIIEGKNWGYHPASILTKLAKATKIESILDASDLDIMQLLDQPFMAQINIKKTTSDKKDEKGEPIVYTNINFGGASECPMMPDDTPYPVPALKTPAMLITFDNVNAETVKYLRADVRRKIKLATNYAGSNMQRVIEAFESSSTQPSEATTKPVEPQSASKTSGSKGKVTRAPVQAPEEFEDDIPFN